MEINKPISIQKSKVKAILWISDCVKKRKTSINRDATLVAPLDIFIIPKCLFMVSEAETLRNNMYICLSASLLDKPTFFMLSKGINNEGKLQLVFGHPQSNRLSTSQPQRVVDNTFLFDFCRFSKNYKIK